MCSFFFADATFYGENDFAVHFQAHNFSTIKSLLSFVCFSHSAKIEGEAQLWQCSTRGFITGPAIIFSHEQ